MAAWTCEGGGTNTQKWILVMLKVSENKNINKTKTRGFLPGPNCIFVLVNFILFERDLLLVNDISWPDLSIELQNDLTFEIFKKVMTFKLQILSLITTKSYVDILCMYNIWAIGIQFQKEAKRDLGKPTHAWILTQVGVDSVEFGLFGQVKSWSHYPHDFF